MNTIKTPKVGQTVLYAIQYGDPVPAKVITVHSDQQLDLQVFHRGSSGCSWLPNSLYDGSDNPKTGTWHWMED